MMALPVLSLLARVHDASAMYDRITLHNAARDGNCQLVQKLLNSKSDPSAQDYQKQTPLQLAVANKHISTVAVFLEHHATSKGTLFVSFLLSIHAC